MTALEAPVVRRRPGFLWLARRYVRSRMRREFDGVHIAGLAEARALVAREPVIVAATHVAWWDPLLAVVLDEALAAESYALMDEANLARLPFFGWVGALPLDRGDARTGLRQLDASATLLDRPGRALWIFPQGTQRPAHLRPLGLKAGIGRLAEKAGVKVVPLAINYLFRQASQPAVLAAFGDPIDPVGMRRPAVVSELEARLVRGLDAIDRFAADGEGSFEALLASRHRGDAPATARLLAPFGGGDHAGEAARRGAATDGGEA